MKRALFAVLFVTCTSALAGWSDLIKPQSGGKKGNKTENLIGSGLGLLQSLQPIGYKEEMAIGGAVALEAVSRFGGLWENPKVENYVVTLGRAVALTSDRPDIPYYFGILNADEPNAFAAPGGYVFVSKGLLKLVKTEGELAGILGHEIAHVAKKHALEAIRRSKMLSSVSEVTLSALDKDPKMFDSIVKETVSLILDRGLEQSKELEADAVGTNFAYRVGYNPAGLKDFLAELQKATPNQKGGLMKTHPKTGDRIARLKAELAKADYKDSQSLPILAQRLTDSFAGAL
jgi:beta-barrel assembly-enhancing protease